jgi:hypothetical protein
MRRELSDTAILNLIASIYALVGLFIGVSIYRFDPTLLPTLVIGIGISGVVYFVGFADHSYRGWQLVPIVFASVTTSTIVLEVEAAFNYNQSPTIFTVVYVLIAVAMLVVWHPVLYQIVFEGKTEDWLEFNY